LARPEPKRLIELAHQSVGDVYGEFLRQSYKTMLNSKQRWVWHDGCDGCDPAAVSKFYNMVTVVIVENVSTDGAWLTLVASRLRPRLGEAMARQPPFVELRQAGGNGEIPKRVHGIAPTYSGLRPGGAPLKVVVVTDSDADRPGQISADAQKVLDSALRYGATVHVLAKRSIENYIPDESLLRYAETRRRRAQAARFISSLRPPARDHYPVKKGLGRQHIDAPHALYPADAPVGLGMGDFVADLLGNLEDVISASGLRARDGARELEELLDKIEENL
jgi:hypothetical protein